MEPKEQQEPRTGQQVDVRALARRAAGRVLAERGLSPGSVESSSGGVHVAVDPSLARAPAPARAAGATRGGRPLVTAECLAETPDGGRYPLPDGARLTPLAEEEAFRRGIRFESQRGPGRRLVAVGSDHGGFALKVDVLAWVDELGHRALDFGTRDTSPVDYPDFAQAVAEAVASGQCDLGVVIDGAGIGSAIAASKVPGVRAATCCDEAMARNAREHNFANVLSLGSGLIDARTAHDILRAFLTTPTGAARHQRRVAKIDAIEARYSRARPDAGARA